MRFRIRIISVRGISLRLHVMDNPPTFNSCTLGDLNSSSADRIDRTSKNRVGSDYHFSSGLSELWSELLTFHTGTVQGKSPACPTRQTKGS